MKPWDKQKKYKEIEDGKIVIDPEKNYSRTQATQLLRMSSEAFGNDYRHSRLWLAYEGEQILDGRAIRFNGAALKRHTERLAEPYYECKLYVDKWQYDRGEMTLDQWYKQGYKLSPEKVFIDGARFVLLEFSE